MTEVDVVLPEGVAEPTTKLASASSSPKQSKTSASVAAADDDERVGTEAVVIEEEEDHEQQKEEHLTEAPSKEKLELLAAGDKDIAKEDVAQASPQAPAPDELMEVDANEVGWEVEGKGMENAPQAGYFQILYLHIDQIAQTYTHLLLHTYVQTY